jgi:hypothetical protein
MTKINKIKTVIQLPFVALGCTIIGVVDADYSLHLLKRWIRKLKP